MGTSERSSLAWVALLALAIIVLLAMGMRLIVSRAVRYSNDLYAKATTISDFAIKNGLIEVHFGWPTAVSSTKDEADGFENLRSLVNTILKRPDSGPKNLKIRILRWPLSIEDNQTLSDTEKLWIDRLKSNEDAQLDGMSAFDGSGVLRRIVPIPATSECINCHKDLNRRKDMQPNDTIGVAFVEVLR